MAVVKPVIFQIVGFQNSGKTTFVKKVVSELKQRDITPVTIKHHGHGGKPEFDHDKDSYQHIQAGAAASLVEGDGHLLLQAEKDRWSLEEQIQLLTSFKPDLVLIEGHKYESYPKAVLIHRDEDLDLLKKLSNIQVAFLWNQQDLTVNFPTFQIDDPAGLQWLIEYFQKLINSIDNQ